MRRSFGSWSFSAYGSCGIMDLDMMCGISFGGLGRVVVMVIGKVERRGEKRGGSVIR